MTRLRYSIYRTTVGILSIAAFGLFVSRVDGESTAPTTQRVVVFPVRSLDSDSDTIAENMTSALIQSLINTRKFEVLQESQLPPIMRNSSEHLFWPKSENISLICEGTARRIGEHYQVVVQIVDGYTNSHAWSQTFESTEDDVQSVVAAVENKILVLAAR